MTYFEDAFNDNNEDIYDIDELQEEADQHRSQIVDATGETNIAVGVHLVDRSDFEVWADGGLLGDKTRYFINFEDLRETLKELYPEADWENLGW